MAKMKIFLIFFEICCKGKVLFSIFAPKVTKIMPMDKNLTKEKFEIFMMLCASGIDGNISMKELERICMQFDEKSYNEVFESWKSMTSPAWLSFFKEHKDEFLKTEEDKAAFMADIQDIVAAEEGEVNLKEKNFMKVLEMLINDEL